MVRELMGLVGGLSLAAAATAQQVCDERSYPLSSPTTRFVDNGDGTVTDTRTRLMWMRCSAGQDWAGGTCTGPAASNDWPAAQALATQVNRDGGLFYADWRVPQLRELATIAERECRNPRVNLAVFPATPAEGYWTASSLPGPGGGATALALSFGNEGVVDRPKQAPLHVRLVRDAQ